MDKKITRVCEWCGRVDTFDRPYWWRDETEMPSPVCFKCPPPYVFEIAMARERIAGRLLTIHAPTVYPVRYEIDPLWSWSFNVQLGDRGVATIHRSLTYGVAKQWTVNFNGIRWSNVRLYSGEIECYDSTGMATFAEAVEHCVGRIRHITKLLQQTPIGGSLVTA